MSDTPPGTEEHPLTPFVLIAVVYLVGFVISRRLKRLG